MQVELTAPNEEKVRLGVRFYYFTTHFGHDDDILGKIAKRLNEYLYGERREVVQCVIESLHKENGKIQAEEMTSGYAICHQVDSYRKLVGRKIAFARAIHELTRLSVPLCSLNGGPKEVRRKLWAAFLDEVKVLGYRKPVVEEAEAVGA